MKMNRTKPAGRLLALLLTALLVLSWLPAEQRAQTKRTERAANRRMPRKRLPCTTI